METEAPAPIAKKRTTKEAPDEKQGRRRMKGRPLRPNKRTIPNSKRNGSVDYISRLPDAILGEIISLLPTKEGARTRILASRWRNLWLSAPLNLDHGSLPTDAQVQASIISKILASHQGPARRFFMRHQAAVADAWLRSAALNNLQELELHVLRVSPLPSFVPWPSLPACAFRFSATLQVVTVKYCRILDSMVEKIHFPQLRELGLDCVAISDDALHSIIAGCPHLEYLLLKACDGFHCPRINSPSLRRICRSLGDWELIIEDAPSLERLFQLGRPGCLDASVISAPRLEALGYLSSGYSESKLVFGTTIIQDLCVVSFTTVICSVKVLAITTYNLSLDMVIDFMRCFPCLEKLYIDPFTSTCRNLWRRKHRDFIRSSDIRLKTVVLKNYRGTKSQANFASFFVLNAKLLELMRFECEEGHDDLMYIEKQHRLLELEKRASRGARFCFTTGRRCHFLNNTHISHVHDLSITDPFECTCK
ncbi:unnamed protein product [Urochloa humidicola]